MDICSRNNENVEYTLGYRDDIVTRLHFEHENKILTNLLSPRIYEFDYYHIILCMQFNRYDLVSRLSHLPECPNDFFDYITASIFMNNELFLRFFLTILSYKTIVINFQCDCSFIMRIIKKRFIKN